MKESRLRSNVTGSQDISKTMAATGRNTSKWSSVDNSLVRLVYQNRHIVERATSGVTREMKNIAWTHIANLLKIRQIARKSPKELRNRWYRLKQTCNKENPTGKDVIVNAILDNTDGCLCESVPVFHLHESHATEGGPPNVDQHLDDTSDNQEEFSSDEESDPRESHYSLSGLEETDPEIRNLTRDKLELEIKLLKLKIKSRTDSHPSTS